MLEVGRYLLHAFLIYLFFFVSSLGLLRLAKIRLRPLWYFYVAPYIGFLFLALVSSSFYILGADYRFGLFAYLTLFGVSVLLYWKTIFSTFSNLIRLKKKYFLIPVFVSSLLICSIPALRGSHGMFNMGPDLYGYLLSSNYIFQGNTYSEAKQTYFDFTHGADPFDPRVAGWAIPDLTSAIGIEFIYRGNRFGLQMVLAQLSWLFRENNILTLIQPYTGFLCIPIVGILQLLLIASGMMGTGGIVLGSLIGGLSTTLLLSVYEGMTAQIASEGAFMLAEILPFFILFRKGIFKQRAKWAVLLAVVLASIIPLYGENIHVLGISFILLSCGIVAMVLIKRLKVEVSLSEFSKLAAVLTCSFLILASPQLWIFMQWTLLRIRHNMGGGALYLGYTDIPTILGLHPNYEVRTGNVRQLQPSTIPLIQAQFLLLSVALGFLRKLPVAVRIFGISILVLCSAMLASGVNNYVFWKVCAIAAPFLFVIVFVTVFGWIDAASKLITNQVWMKPLKLTILAASLVLAFVSYGKLFRGYKKQAELIRPDELLPFATNKEWSKTFFVIPNDHQLYWIPAIGGSYFWLNSGWGPYFESVYKKDAPLSLLVLCQVEGVEKCNKIRERFKLKYQSNAVLIAELDLRLSDLVDDKTFRTNHDRLKKYLTCIDHNIMGANNAQQKCGEVIGASPS